MVTRHKSINQSTEGLSPSFLNKHDFSLPKDALVKFEWHRLIDSKKKMNMLQFSHEDTITDDRKKFDQKSSPELLDITYWKW